MVGLLIFVVIIVVVIFFYMHRKAKSRSSSDLNSVQDYHASYDRLKTRRELRDRHTGYRPYVTKYNSTEDYRERNGR